MQSRYSIDIVKILFWSRAVILADILLLGSGLGLKATSAKVEVEVEAELGNIQFGLLWFTLSVNTYTGGWVGGCVGCVSLTLRLTHPKLKSKLRLSLATVDCC